MTFKESIVDWHTAPEVVTLYAMPFSQKEDRFWIADPYEPEKFQIFRCTHQKIVMVDNQIYSELCFDDPEWQYGDGEFGLLPGLSEKHGWRFKRFDFTDVVFGKLFEGKSSKHLARQSLSEADYQTQLQTKVGGQVEVKTKLGRIDLLTDNTIYELKHFRLWKSAVGQLLAYGETYPRHRKVLALFGKPGDDIETIRNILGKVGIELEVLD